jgi:SAM-dependent methyltransferase
MPSPRISALVLARDEAANLPGCLAALDWADELVVVVDRASRDATEAIARRAADVVAVRDFVSFADQRNAALDLAGGDWVFAVDADERATPALAAEIRRVVAEATAPLAGYRVPIRSVILGRPFAYSGTQHDRPLRLFRRDSGRWIGAVHETVALRGTAGQLTHALEHCTLPDLSAFLAKLNTYTTLEAQESLRLGRRVRAFDLCVRPVWTFAKLYLGKQGFRDGVEGFVFCALSGLSVAVRHWKHRELIRALPSPLRPGGARLCSLGRKPQVNQGDQKNLRSPEGAVLGAGARAARVQHRPSGAQEPGLRGLVPGLSPRATRPRPSGAKTNTYPSRTIYPSKNGETAHEATVSARFDELEACFKAEVPSSDVRLRSALAALTPGPCRRLLDLGCGKGRFAAHLQDRGAEVVGLDLSAAMLARAGGLSRVRGSARRLPFAAESFDGVLAVEVLQHVAPRGLDAVLAELRRVLRPGGTVAIIDKNAGALNARRPWLPGLVVKEIDRRRGRWMYPPDAPVRERWFWPGDLKERLRRWFVAVQVVYLLSAEEAGRWPFERIPATRQMALWTARAPGGDRG